MPRWCGRAEVEAAAARIAGSRSRDPGARARAWRARTSRAPLTLKLELFQRTGSFKLRGAFSALLDAEVGEAGIVAASGGNFGIAAAVAAEQLGIPAAIFVPEASPAAKVDRLRRTAAEVVVTGALYDDSLAAAHERAAQTGALEIHAFDDPRIVAGQGTCGRELDRQRPGLDTVLVGVGGGGLCAGTAAWYGDGARVLAVEPAASQAYARAREAGEPVEVEVGGIAADSLGRAAGRRSSVGGDVALGRGVGAGRGRSDSRWPAAPLGRGPSRRRARRGGGARPRCTSGAYVPEPGERVGVLVSGGNFDPADAT